jgi:hypothetical protein
MGTYSQHNVPPILHILPDDCSVFYDYLIKTNQWFDIAPRHRAIAPQRCATASRHNFSYLELHRAAIIYFFHF